MRIVGSVSAMSAIESELLSQNATTLLHQQLEVQFGTLVLHRVSIYITWPPRETDCGGDTGSTVVGYRLRYQDVDSANEFIVRQLTDSFLLLENVPSNVRYRFQVKYVFDDGSETDWSVERLVDTTPTHRHTVTN